MIVEEIKDFTQMRSFGESFTYMFEILFDEILKLF